MEFILIMMIMVAKLMMIYVDYNDVVDSDKVNASSTLHFIAVSNRFNRCLDHCFCSFRSLFESISIEYTTLELNNFVFEAFYLSIRESPSTAL